MDFRIADTFTDSLVRLAGDEQKAVKTTAFDLQLNPASPGMQFHKLDRARDKRFWSVRVSRDVRLIVHRSDSSLLLCYVDHHDAAYRWAECRRLERHPATGAAQLVEIREQTEIIKVPKYVDDDELRPPTTISLAHASNDELLAYGVPEEWLAEVRSVRDEDGLLALTDHLPAEAAEALLELATGGIPTPAAVQGEVADPFEHPDAQRRFRIMADKEELERALDSPWDKWAIFLHPAQRDWVERDYNGPARVAGSAGTGKTIVALHRAVRLARENADSRVLLTTFSEPLANALRVKLRRLIGNQPRLAERLDVFALDEVGQRLYEKQFGDLRLASEAEWHGLLDTAAADHPDHGFSRSFLRSEWRHVVDAWQLTTWEEYRDVRRLGRKTGLPEARRHALWEIFADLHDEMRARSWTTTAGMYARLEEELPKRRHPPYDFAVIDEAQDISVAQLRFLAALGANRPDSLFFAGDLGQRIFQQPFSWKSLGVDIRGRSQTLRVNYRTSHQIRTQADRLLDPVVADVDGNGEERKGTVSVFNGPQPVIRTFPDAASESAAVGKWLRACMDEGMVPNEVAVFVRSENELDRALAAAAAANLPATTLTERINMEPGKLLLGVMHLAKGLEFRAVAIMACDDEVIPSSERIEAIADEADLEDVYNTERHLLYVACTRARDRLHVSAISPASEFLDDLQTPGAG